MAISHNSLFVMQPNTLFEPQKGIFKPRCIFCSTGHCTRPYDPNYEHTALPVNTFDQEYKEGFIELHSLFQKIENITKDYILVYSLNKLIDCHKIGTNKAMLDMIAYIKLVPMASLDSIYLFIMKRIN